MLNKEICKRCINETFLSCWQQQDEDKWKRGEVACFELIPTKEVPAFCRYCMEQTVLGQEKDNET